MSAAVLETGAELAPKTYPITRASLVRYAGASGDFNPIHWSDRVATAVGLPGVIAHGMFTMALVARAVAEWTDGAEVVDLGAKFTNPVVVPDDDTGTEVTISGTVKSVADGLATIQLTVVSTGSGPLRSDPGEPQKVLGMPKVSVRV
ncbi:MAG: MaoC/PaaZ C-terminal domain-containing protein [Nocardioides sp.]|uniref:MaoC/PaaZ C-terminal domain-containing protein n=1 Tax=Nocardioides sp. TaxID=35761 RepID=UPI003D6AFD0B